MFREVKLLYVIQKWRTQVIKHLPNPQILYRRVNANVNRAIYCISICWAIWTNVPVKQEVKNSANCGCRGVMWEFSILSDLFSCKLKTTLKQLKCIRKKKMKTNELQFTPDLTDWWLKQDTFHSTALNLFNKAVWCSMSLRPVREVKLPLNAMLKRTALHILRSAMVTINSV